jgi:putative membrane protein
MSPHTAIPGQAPATAPALPRRGRGTSPAHAAAPLAWALAAAAVLAQIAYPLVDGRPRDHLTVATVALAFAAVTAHAARRHGGRTACALIGTTLAVALAVEVVGVHTGLPFGRYSYGDTLGPRLLGVPLVVPCAWVMTAYPALVVARRLVRRRPRARPLAVPVVAGWALASWDVFLDPQMVAAGHWRWHDPSPALPGSPGIPLTNYAGWVVVAIALMGLLDRLMPPGDPPPADDLLPGLLYVWTYASQVLGNAVFFDRPAVALLGGVAMGLVALPYAATLTRHRV